ncbi:MAG: hypothetical protein GC191_16590 [Azospirillum sp.]|nr:hypothetical protein [Azospirillum sp.]
MTARTVCAILFALGWWGFAGAYTLSPEESRSRGDEAYARGDHVIAVQWYRAAADKGNTPAQVILGWLYRNGDGVAQDYGEALRWFRLAALLGNAGAEYSLGTLYEHGRGVAADAAEAARWYRKAASRGNAQAQNNLGWLYQNGRGVPQDFAEAARWYRLAAAQGQPDALGNLGLLTFEGKGVAANRQEGLRLLRLAAAQGDAEAQEVVDRLAPAAPMQPVGPAAHLAAKGVAVPMSGQPLPPRPGPPRAEPRRSEPGRPESARPELPGLAGAWQSAGPVVDQGLRQMFLRMEIAERAVTFRYDCRFLDGSRLTGSFTSRVEISERTIRVIDGGRSHAEDANNSCSASLAPITLGYRLGGTDLSVDFGGRTVTMRRLSAGG